MPPHQHIHGVPFEQADGHGIVFRGERVLDGFAHENLAFIRVGARRVPRTGAAVQLARLFSEQGGVAIS